MTEELLIKSNELKKEISELSQLIGNLAYRIHSVKNKDQYPENCNTPTSKFYRLKLKLGNKQRNEEKQARIIVFDNDHLYGTEIEVDEEFVLYVKDFFEKKLAAKRKQFEELN